MDEKREIGPGYGMYIAVWAALLVLTALAVALSRPLTGLVGIAIPISIATIKAFLVVSFFMHLWYEERFFKVIIWAVVVTLFIILWFLFSDLAWRY